MLTEAGGEILYHSFLCDVKMQDNEIKYVTVAGKNGTRKIYSKIFIDATGDADISRFCGLKTHSGRKSDGKCQPLTLNMKLYNVDTEKIKQYIKNNPDDFPRMDVSKIENAPRISVGGYNNTFSLAKESSEITFDREFLLFFETNNPSEVIVNTTRISNINPLEPEELTKAEVEGRRQCEEVFNFLKNKISGFENAKIAYTGPSVGVRGSAQIEGLYTITETDIVTCKNFDDTIAHGAYPIDIHPPEGADDSMFDVKKLKDGNCYNIPYRCLIGKTSNLITVGRCISATFEAQAAIRVSPIAGAIGHAGGVAAAVSLKNKTPVQKTDVQEIQKLLFEQGAYI